MTKTVLLNRLGLVSVVVAGGIVGRPARVNAQLAQRQQSQTLAVATHIERSTAVDSAFGPFVSRTFDSRIDPEAQHLFVPPVGMDYVSTRAISTLQSSEHGSRSKHVLIGALAGTAVGAAAAVAFPAKCRTSASDVPCALGAPIELAVNMSLGAVVGGVIGALVPAGH